MTVRALGSRSNHRWLRRLSLALLWLLVLIYVGAKTHFFVRFDPHGIRAYIVEHSLFWVAMLLLGGFIWFVDLLIERRCDGGASQ